MANTKRYSDKGSLCLRYLPSVNGSRKFPFQQKESDAKDIQNMTNSLIV